MAEETIFSPLNYMRAEIKKIETLLERTFERLCSQEDILLLSQKILAICEEVRGVLEENRPVHALACGAGCARCCHNLIEINPFWSFIAIETLKKNIPQQTQEMIKERLFAHDIYQACPFLLQNHCTIYQNRPPVCRGYYSFDLSKCLEGFYCEKDLIPASGYRGDEVHGAYHYMVFLYILEHKLQEYEEKLGIQSKSLFLHDAIRTLSLEKDAAQKWLQKEKIF